MGSAEGFGTVAGFVLVVDDDPLVGDAIVRHLRALGCRTIGVDDFDLAFELCVTARPAVVVLDQIVGSPEAEELLRKLDEREDGPVVVLLRYEPGPVGPFANLYVTVVGGESWLEQLGGVVGRFVYAHAY